MEDQQLQPGDLTRPRAASLRGVAAALAVAAAVFVGAGGFAGAMLRPYLADRVLVHVKEEIAQAATLAITTLWTYTPDDIDTLTDRAGKYLTGDFEARYRKFVESIAGTSKQQQSSVTTAVVGVAVISVDGASANALVYTNTSMTSPVTKGIPAVQYLSHQLSMTRAHGRWLATELSPLTKFSVTPQF